MKSWSRLEGRYAFNCKNPDCDCYPGACYEDWRTKKLICPLYKPSKKDVVFNPEELISAVEDVAKKIKCKTCDGKGWVYTEWYGYEAAEEPPSEPCPKCNPEGYSNKE